jgi:hypothetical protein
MALKYSPEFCLEQRRIGNKGPFSIAVGGGSGEGI